MNKFIWAVRYALAGIKACFQSERNFRIEVLGLIFLILSAWYFQFSILEWAVCLLCASLVLAFELLNTAIERAIDLSTEEIHPLAKISKDCSAGAVLIAAITSLVIWVIIVISKS